MLHPSLSGSRFTSAEHHRQRTLIIIKQGKSSQINQLFIFLMEQWKIQTKGAQLPKTDTPLTCGSPDWHLCWNGRTHRIVFCRWWTVTYLCTTVSIFFRAVFPTKVNTETTDMNKNFSHHSTQFFQTNTTDVLSWLTLHLLWKYESSVWPSHFCIVLRNIMRSTSAAFFMPYIKHQTSSIIGENTKAVFRSEWLQIEMRTINKSKVVHPHSPREVLGTKGFVIFCVTPQRASRKTECWIFFAKHTLNLKPQTHFFNSVYYCLKVHQK